MNVVARVGDGVPDLIPTDADGPHGADLGPTTRGLDATLPLNSGRTTALARREREG